MKIEDVLKPLDWEPVFENTWYDAGEGPLGYDTNLTGSGVWRVRCNGMEICERQPTLEAAKQAVESHRVATIKQFFIDGTWS